MATMMPPTRPVADVGPVTPWQKEDPRQAVLARLLGANGQPLPVAATDLAPSPGGLVRARLIEARLGNEALVDIGGKSFLIRTRQPLPPGESVLLRIMDPAADDDRILDPRAARAADARGAAGAGASGLPVARPGLEPAAADGPEPTLPTRAQTPPAEALRADTGDAKIRVSGPARLLSELAPPGTNTARPIQMPPLTGPQQTDPTRAAQQMRNAVEHSGLFYESHVQAWSEGRRPLESLRAEPQGALPAAKPGDPIPDLPDAAEGSGRLAEARNLSAALASIPANVRPLVQDQIALLETPQLGLQGMWQGQPFTLHIEPDERHKEGKKLPNDPIQNWKVRIELNAPNMGPLQVDIALAGEAAKINVRAAHTERAQAGLGNQARDLAEALYAHGVKVHALKIDTNPLGTPPSAPRKGKA